MACIKRSPKTKSRWNFSHSVCDTATVTKRKVRPTVAAQSVQWPNHGAARTRNCDWNSSREKYISSPKRPARSWNPPSLPFNGYRRLFPRLKAVGTWG